MNFKAKVGASVVGLFIIVVLILLAMSIQVINQGHAGVVYNRTNGIQEETLGQGWRMVSPMDRVTEYPVSTETVKVDSFSVQTKDGKPLTIDLSYDYMNDLEKLPYIYNKFKGQKSEVIQDGWLHTRVKKSALTVFSQYSVLDVFQNQGEINAKNEDHFRNSVEDHGFLVDSVTLGAPTPDEQTAKSIQEVVNASQELERSEIKKQQAIIDAETLIEKANGIAESNDIIRKSISQEMINYNAIEKWDGKLPTVTGESIPMIQMPSEVKDEK